MVKFSPNIFDVTKLYLFGLGFVKSVLRAGGVVLYRELGEPLRGMNGRGLG